MLHCGGLGVLGGERAYQGLRSRSVPTSWSLDKNQYWLLNPVPDDQMRNFSTDRPTKSNVPCTVDAGHFQYETDIVNFTHQVTGSVHTSITLLVPNPTFKVGLTNNIDLELNIAPVVGVHTFNSSAALVEYDLGQRRPFRSLKGQPVGR